MKVDILLQNSYDIKSWPGTLARPVLSSALQTLNLLPRISGFWWKIFKCHIFALTLRMKKCSYELVKSRYFIVLFPCSCLSLD